MSKILYLVVSVTKSLPSNAFFNIIKSSTAILFISEEGKDNQS